MNRHFVKFALGALCAFCLAPAAAPPVSAAEHEGDGKRNEAPPPMTPGARPVAIRKKAVVAPKPPAVDGVRGAENFCGALAASAASTRLAWQEARIKTLQNELLVKTAELDAKEAEVRDWVRQREQLLAKADAGLTAIYAKMKPDAAASQLQAMNDEVAAALLLKLKPSIASALMGEIDPARAAHLSDLLTGAAPNSDGKKS